MNDVTTDRLKEIQSELAAILEARRAHKPTRHIEAERRDYVHNALRGRS